MAQDQQPQPLLRVVDTVLWPLRFGMGTWWAGNIFFDLCSSVVPRTMAVSDPGSHPSFTT